MLLDFNIKNNEPGSNKKDRAIADPAIRYSMPLLNTSSITSSGEISFAFRHCVDKYEKKLRSSLRLTFQDVAFNTFKAVFKFSILLQLRFYAHNRAADRTVSVSICSTKSMQNHKNYLPPFGLVHHMVPGIRIVCSQRARNG
jgi:hypothetical protein